MSSLHAARRVLVIVVVFGAFWLSGGTALGHVVLDKPNGGEVLEVGSVYVIEWHVMIEHGTLNWDLWYSTTGLAGTWIPIAMDLPAGDITAGSIHTFDWTVPDTPSDEVVVKVRQDNESTNYTDVSNANSTIGTTPPECIDDDEDGYGFPGNVLCANGSAEDCDDSDPDINPGAAEVCDDTIDNDCDGFTDDTDPECSENTVVLQVGLTFDPADVMVHPGDTVEWRYATGNHTVTSGAPCTLDGRFDMLLDGSNTVATYTVPLEEPDGVIPYFCIPHCGVSMTGTITVSSGSPIPAASEWGMVAMTLLLLAAGTLVFSRRHSPRVD